MDLSERMQWMADNRNFSDITIEDFKNHFFQSGSSVFGKPDKDSDIDFLVHPSLNRLAFAITKFFHAEREEYYSDEIYSYSFTIKSGERINLIAFKKGDYKAWTFATNNMKNLYNTGTSLTKKIIEDKPIRCDMFQYFVGLFNRL